MGFFGKGNLSRSKPEYEIISDISQKAFSNSDKLRRLPPKERQIRQSKFREIRKERHRNHSHWQRLANLSEDNECHTSQRTNEESEMKKAQHENDTSEEEPCKKMKMEEDEVDLFEDDSDECNDDSDDLTHDTSSQDENKTNSSDKDDNELGGAEVPVQVKKSEVIGKSRKKVDPYKVFEHLQLTLEEAFFLSYGLGCLNVYDDNKKALSIGDLWREFSQVKKNFIPCYIAYHYYRSKGWVPKCGIKYGTDFVIYKEGMPFYHSSYSVIVQVADQDSLEPVMTDVCTPYTWAGATGLNRVSEHAAKEIMICYVLLPSGITEKELCLPCCIPRFKVQEVVLRRWIPERSREPTKTTS
ncbi:tRNA-splicing endonuclease subunit Sen2 [Exaiptasia diaphana]|nr:tRNA-splicing endonuclease subunit Sen2 [Exaiptasia diaphana]